MNNLRRVRVETIDETFNAWLHHFLDVGEGDS